MSAVAELVPAVDLDRCIEVFSRSSQDRAGSPWSRDDVGPAARLRIYRAIAAELWVLDSHDRRIPVPPGPPPGGPTSYDNLKPRCWPHHRDKTELDRLAGLLDGRVTEARREKRGPP